MELSLAKGKPPSTKPMRLKDYLVDELSSCSSNGFRSYPRQQCCPATFRLLVELDLKNKPPKYMKKTVLKNPSKDSISAIQRASNALINAVKHLPFASSASTLPRKLSRKLLKRCFRKRTDNLEIKRRGFFIAGRNSSSSVSETNGESYSWSGSDFTASDESLRCSSVNSEVKVSTKSSNHGVVPVTNGQRLRKDRVVKHMIVAAIVGGDDSTGAITGSNSSNSKKPWTNEEKEQFSPVSVLDCAFEDDEEEVSSPFQRRLARVKGSNERQMKRIPRLKRLTKLEPINLEKRIASSESDHDSSASPLYDSSHSSSEESIGCKIKEEGNDSESKALELLRLVRDTMPSSAMVKLNAVEKLLLDFLKGGIDIGLRRTMGLTGDVVCDKELLNIANDWLEGKPREPPPKREAQKNMEACIRDMEREGKWRSLDEERKEVVLELEAEVFASLVNEVLHGHLIVPNLRDLFTSN